MKIFLGGVALVSDELFFCYEKFVLLLCFCMLGCGEPSAASLAGEWLLSKSSLPLLNLNFQKIRSSRIELKTNGTFVAVQVPSGMTNLRNDPSTLVDGIGTWKFDPVSNTARVLMVFSTANGEPIKGGFGFTLEISGYNKPDSLFYYLGDPDQVKVVRFVRKPAQ